MPGAHLASIAWPVVDCRAENTMRVWLIIASVAMALACTANDGTPRADFYPSVTVCSTAFDCPDGQSCYQSQCYAVVTCTTSADCAGNPAPLPVCKLSPGGSGECVMCVTPEDCTSRGLGSACASNNECTP